GRSMGEIADERTELDEHGTPTRRVQLKVGNRDLGGADFMWVDATSIISRERPRDAVVLERLEWGKFYGRMVELRRGDEVLARGGEAVWDAFAPLHREKRRQWRAVERLQRRDIGDVNYEIESLRLERLRVERGASSAVEKAARLGDIARRAADAQSRYDALA